MEEDKPWSAKMHWLFCEYEEIREQKQSQAKSRGGKEGDEFEMILLQPGMESSGLGKVHRGLTVKPCSS